MRESSFAEVRRINSGQESLQRGQLDEGSPGGIERDVLDGNGSKGDRIPADVFPAALWWRETVRKPQDAVLIGILVERVVEAAVEEKPLVAVERHDEVWDVVEVAVGDPQHE